MDDRLTGEAFDDDGDANEDVRYGLTALGASHLRERRAFVGFGPCSAMRPSEAPEKLFPAGRRTLGRPRIRRAASLFG